jgi:uncharacterized membrane protein YgaE (UPF0421/DUF939 family)
MFDDAKYMAKEAVDRNNAISDLDQQRAEDKVHRWSRHRSVRRVIAVLLALVIAAFPLITALNEPRVFVVYALAWLAVFALARTAMRAAPAGPIGRTEFLVLAGLAALSAVVALSAQTDVNLQAGVTATAGIVIAVITAAISASPIVRCWR